MTRIVVALRAVAAALQWRRLVALFVCTKVDGHAAPDPIEVPSPGGKWAVSRRGYSLSLRSDEIGGEASLTRDAACEDGYAVAPGCC